MNGKTAEALEQFKNIVVDATYDEYMLSGAGLKLTRAEKEIKASFYCFTVASTNTGKHMELWALSTRILAEKIRMTRAKRYPVSEIFEVESDNPLIIMSNPFFKYPVTKKLVQTAEAN